MTLTERGDSPPSRTWEGTVDRVTYERFARAWSLPDDLRPPARQADDVAPRRHTLDGMNWEERGASPIVSVTLQVTPVNTGGPDS